MTKSKKAFVTISFIFLSVFLSSKSLSAIVPAFSKSSNNPLQIEKSYDNWNEVGIFQKSIIYTDKFQNWYASFNGSDFKVAYMTSDDGINWKSYGPILNSVKATHDPNVLIDGGQYIMAYAESDGGNNNFQIKIIRSQDPQFSNLNLTTSLPPLYGWENEMVPAHILKDDTLYKLFYIIRDNGKWKLNLATSSDLHSWSRCSSPISEDDGDLSLFELDNQVYFFEHDPFSNGIFYRTIEGQIDCNMTFSNRTYVVTKGPLSYDITHILSPSLLSVKGITYLYYSGRDPNGKWTLNLATDQPISSPTPTPSPTTQPTQTPTPTATPQPSPTPTPQEKIILIPGTFGSWHKDALLHGATAPQSEWILNPISHEFDGIMHTLENLGYQQNQDFFVFPYDWRQPVETTSQQLKEYITSTISDDNSLSLIGHSLGGLVARVYSQRYKPHNLDKIITVGSPHKGSPMPYKALSGGEIEASEGAWLLAQKVLIQSYKKTNPLLSDRQILSQKMPVLYDLLPLYDYLKSPLGSTYPLTSMHLQNNLSSYQTDIDDLNPKLYTFGGKSIHTPESYIVTPPTQVDLLLGNYTDGHPTQTIPASGDGLVLEDSSLIGTHKTELPHHNHGDIIYESDSIKAILDTLDIPYSDADIVKGGPTVVFPSIIFLIFSPATLSVIHNGTTYHEQEGFVYIPSPSLGTYTIKARGLTNGPYTIVAGRLVDNTVHWDTIQGTITADVPTSETDTYTYTLSSFQQMTSPLLPTDLYIEINDLLSKSPSGSLNPYFFLTKQALFGAKKTYDLKQYPLAKTSIYSAHDILIKAYGQASPLDRQTVIVLLEKVGNLTAVFLKGLKPPTIQQLNLQKKDTENALLKKTQLLAKVKSRGQSIQSHLPLFDYLQKKFDALEQNWDATEPWNKEIQLLSISKLVEYIR